MHPTDAVRRIPASLIAVALFVGSLAIYLASPVHTQFDSYWSTYAAASIVHHGDADLDEYDTALERASDFQVVHVEGSAYYRIPLPTTLFAVPFVAIADHVDGNFARELSDGDPPALDPFIAAVIAAAAVAVVFGNALLAGASRRAAVVVGVTFALGTAAWSTLSRALWMQGPSVLLVAVAVNLMLRLQRGRGGHLAAGLLGAAVVSACFVRPTNAVLMAAAATWVVVAQRRRLPTFVVGAVASGALLLAANRLLVGAAIPAYYLDGGASGASAVAEALIGNLVSPTRGLVVYSPVMLLAVWGAVLRIRAGTSRSLDVLLAGVVVGQLLVVSVGAPAWWAGWSYGPRFMADVLPVLAYFLVPAVDRVLALMRDRASSSLVPALAVLLLAVSVTINARGALSPAPFAWNVDPTNVDTHPDRLWDWTDPPFLR